MADPTFTGYHAPTRIDPVEPALADEHPDAEDTDPSDVAILAGTLEAAHARCEVRAASAVTDPSGAQVVDASTLRQSEEGVYYVDDDTNVKVTEDGLYRATVRVTAGSGGSVTARLIHLLGVGEVDRREIAANATCTLTAVVAVEAERGFHVIASGSGTTSRIRSFVVERLGPVWPA